MARPACRGIRMLTWNAGHCCAAAMEANVDDVGFIGAIIDALVSNGRADPARVYVTGMSNGAMMAHRLGRELSTRLAAIAPVVGAVFGDEPPPRAPVPAFIIVGAEDEIVPPGGGPLRVRAILGRTSADRDVAPAIAQATYWARHNGCGEPTRTQAKAASRMEWQRCTSGAPVVYQSVAGNGHAWPGGEPGREGAAQPTRDFDASAAMWEFFKTQAAQALGCRMLPLLAAAALTLAIADGPAAFDADAAQRFAGLALDCVHKDTPARSRTS